MNESTDRLAAEKIVADLERFAADVGRYAAFLRDNLDVAAAIGTCRTEVKSYLYLAPGANEDVKAAIADYGRRARRAGAEMTKDFGDDYAGAELTFGDASLLVYSRREQVCERVVVGTRQVEIEEPDPAAVAALPKVKRVETVEDVEWRCSPILADETEKAGA